MFFGFNNKDKNSALEVYKLHFESRSKNENNISTFLITFFGAVGGFFYFYITQILLKKTEKVDTLNVSNLLLCAAILGTIIFLWGTIYIFTMAYRSRYEKILMWEYEENLGLKHFAKWDPWKKGKFSYWNFDFLPSYFKAHIIGFSLGIGFIWGIYFYHFSIDIIYFYIFRFSWLINTLLFIILYYVICCSLSYLFSFKYEELKIDYKTNYKNKKKCWGCGRCL